MSTNELRIIVRGRKPVRAPLTADNAEEIACLLRRWLPQIVHEEGRVCVIVKKDDVSHIAVGMRRKS